MGLVTLALFTRVFVKQMHQTLASLLHPLRPLPRLTGDRKGLGLISPFSPGHTVFWEVGMGGVKTQKNRFTLYIIPCCLGSLWILEAQVARRSSHLMSPGPSNVDVCNFMDCLDVQFNLEFHNMKVSPWYFIIGVYLEGSCNSFFPLVLEIKPCFGAGHTRQLVREL